MEKTNKDFREPFDSKQNLKPYLNCVDHTVSRETFSLLLDPEIDLLVTEPRPSENDLASYYESDDYISHTDAKRSLMDKLYQTVKNYSLKKKLNLINTLAGRKGHLLDIGCGTGDLLSVCEKDGWKIAGVEPSEKARELAKEKIDSEVDLRNDLKEVSNTEARQYDVITMWHVLEHVPNLMEYIQMLKELLTENGHLIVAVPNFKSYDANHYKEFWAAYDVPRHLWHFSEKSIRSIFGQNDFEVIETLPLIFDSFYVSLLSEKYKSGRSNLLGGFVNGLKSNMKARSSGEYSSKIYILKKA